MSQLEGTNQDRKLFAGMRIRRLRRELGLTQAVMADSLGISTSYLNLIERDQRPVSAQILIKMVDVFDIDPRGLAGDEEARAYTQLREIFADPMFHDTPVADQEIRDISAASPNAVDAIARLFQTYRDASTTSSMLAERLADNTHGETTSALMSFEEVRDFINQRSNHFPELDDYAEELYMKAGLVDDDPFLALRHYLQETHGVSTRIGPVDLMGDDLRRYDRHRQTLFLSELLNQSSRAFQIAYQLAYFEHSKAVEEIINGSKLENLEAQRLARLALINYAAAAILMPYGVFLQTAEDNGYDITLLSRRFGTSFEQVCHRLTTLQRPGAKGVPFFLIRIDNAGNVSKRFAAGGFHFSRFGGTCPRWNIHDSFRQPGKVMTQIICMEDNTRYFSVSRTVSRNRSAFDKQDNQFAIGLGCEISHASKLVYSHKYNLEETKSDMPIGVNCRLCERLDCHQRATPPLMRSLRVDDNIRGLSPFDF